MPSLPWRQVAGASSPGHAAAGGSMSTRGLVRAHLAQQRQIFGEVAGSKAAHLLEHLPEDRIPQRIEHPVSVFAGHYQPAAAKDGEVLRNVALLHPEPGENRTDG